MASNPHKDLSSFSDKDERQRAREFIKRGKELGEKLLDSDMELGDLLKIAEETIKQLYGSDKYSDVDRKHLIVGVKISLGIDPR